MKKIISALAVGAMVAGSAFADMKVSLNYRNGAELLKYVNNGAGGRSTDDYGNVYIDSGYDQSGSSTTIGNLTGWNAGKDNLGLSIAGNIFTVKTTLQPTVASDSIIMHVLDFGAKQGNFTANAGWNGDGVMGFRVKKFADDGNEEGKVGETFKLGSIFTGSDGLCANNVVSFGTGRNYYAYAGYNVPVAEGISVKVQAGTMIDRQWDTTAEINNGNFGWSAFLDPKIKDVLDAELFVKGKKVGEAGSDKVSEFVTGGYFKLNMLPKMVADNTIGGSVVIYDGHLMEYNADWRVFVKPAKDLWITYFGKFAKLVSNDDTGYDEVDGASVGALAGLTAFKSSQSLWNMVNARYKINDRFTGALTVGSLTDLDSGFQSGRYAADGTQVYAHPHVQIYAAKNATITCGVLAGFGGIGADEGANKDVDILINIPLLFRVKM